MPLDAYRARRDFRATPEPHADAARSDPERLSFVVQRHDARRLHYDLRLELDGVLLSWAVPKGPSLDPGEKRLAVRTEDHPLAYRDFEGTIPKGEYGGGTVRVWDRGAWRPEGDARAGLAKGHLAFELAGERLRGGWHLVRTGGDHWLLIKRRDPHAGVAGGGEDEVPWPIAPQLATARDAPPSGEGWVHEIKLDGYRLLARLRDGEVSLCTRSGLDWTDKAPAIADAVRALPARDLVLDGELVALDPRGKSSFGLLQERLKAGTDLWLYAFDLLQLDGRDLRALPLLERKERLAALLSGDGRVRFGEHLDLDGPTVLRHLCALGAEGLVSKRADAPYRSGRTAAWVKVKCLGRDDFVVGGFLERQPGTLASVLLGRREAGGLRYAGRAGSGFTEAQRAEVRRRLAALAVPEAPFLDPPKLPRGDRPTWVAPSLSAEVSFTERTRDGLLRHPVFVGLREDRPVVSNPAKVLYPEIGLTKQDLADWVDEMAGWILPGLVDRPLTLVRCPNGHDRPPRFFMKHRENVPDSVVPVSVPGDDVPYMAVRGPEGLIGLVQAAALEVHPWGSRVDRPELPDRLILDLDPDEALPFAEVVSAAREARQRLADLGLTSFVRTTGGKGLHVVAPFERGPPWDALKAFTRDIAEQMVRDAPKRYVAVATKARRKGKIFVDYLRNGMGATAIGSWWFRARPGAPVACPVRWEDLAQVDPTALTVRTVRPPDADPWDGFAALRQRLPT